NIYRFPACLRVLDKDTVLGMKFPSTATIPRSKSDHATKSITSRAGGRIKFKDTLFALQGCYAGLAGMIFDNGMVAVLGNYNRVTRNVFKNGKRAGNRSKLRSAIHTEGAAKYNRFDHNEVMHWQRWAIRNTKVNGGTKGNRFDHNYLHDLLGQWGNTGEALQVGTGPGAVIFEPGTIIEYNLIDGHNLESEILSLKASSNIVRGNTFINAPKGSVTTRTSSNNLLMNNTFINIKGLSIYADNNKVIGNKFINSNLNIKSGDAIFPELLENNSKYQGAHPAARKTLVVGNQFSDGKIRLGNKGTGNKEFNRTFPAENTILISNHGGVVVRVGAVEGTETRTQYSW
ncbi:hypothetical protein C2W62_44475, partial [Candidatus Entotheonella serta]